MGLKGLETKTYSRVLRPGLSSCTDIMGNIINWESQFPPRARDGGVCTPRSGRGDVYFNKERGGNQREFGKISSGHRGIESLWRKMCSRTGSEAFQIYLNFH